MTQFVTALHRLDTFHSDAVLVSIKISGLGSRGNSKGTERSGCSGIGEGKCSSGSQAGTNSPPCSRNVLTSVADVTPAAAKAPALQLD
ncbi:hypothetical protein O3P69_007722 [Scylla paramamosain]|uniref:Uncharacterized protein n=1 Tax=Scylla paramamosain TaxID=85552 RepID=A0AAW0UYL9_SCYPA